MTPEEVAATMRGWFKGTMWETNPGADFRPEPFPLTLQLSANLIRNTNRGTLTAEAEVVHRGRTTLVVEVAVVDDARRLIAKLVATLLAPTSTAATAPVELTGR